MKQQKYNTANTVINLYKEQGQTSSSQTYSLRSLFKSKKAGHLGTLDPMATGVLPVFLGKYTKLIPFLEKADKTYFATIKLGQCSDTFDAKGQTIDSKPFEHITKDQIEKTIESFCGKQIQMTPPYAAVKHQGIPAYKLARQGQANIRKIKEVHFKSIIIEHIDLPYIQIKVCCSAGTYIRTLADDLGRKLGSYALLESLQRTQVGPYFSIETSISLEKLKQSQKINEAIPCIDPIKLLHTWHTIEANVQQTQSIKNGSCVEISSFPIVEDNLKVHTKMLDDSRQLIAVGYLAKRNYQTYFYPEKVFI